ncbi:glycosyltransferase family 2 protein [Pontiella sulfatireligans]|uniref:GalNAc(5)-diNAcBac-PP-undecaprenol beta-1,3-glucosyltransferase n=1 Tax=Pontiella sulfatireligans TaxID=2750658 RepID=A0A6C2UFF4_9BACT|nr:glycosyltransferase family 2 protein [Pontiella sulfatireligans]VGO18257.1 GalNAc(5)-diNAcBac-PP-undecaprenol beta-1,3-glucosyltransferase [Pontiella sulfatireligans]
MNTTHDAAGKTWIEPSFEPELVSVIVPTYNREVLLLETLQSVFEQTYRPIELIVVDDGSNDDTGKAVAKWGQGIPEDESFRFRYLLQENRGACAARNLGLLKSCGEFIEFLDSDDLLHPENLEALVSSIQSSPVNDLAYAKSGKFETVPDWSSPSVLSGRPCADGERIAAFSGQPLWLNGSAVYRRRLCAKVGGWNQEVLRCQDWEYNMRVLLADPGVTYVDQVLSLVRLHGDGRISDQYKDVAILRNMFEVTRNVETMLKEAGRFCPACEKEMSGRYLHICKNAIFLGDRPLAADVLHWSAPLRCSRIENIKRHFWRAMTYLPKSAGALAIRGYSCLFPAK